MSRYRRRDCGSQLALLSCLVLSACSPSGPLELPLAAAQSSRQGAPHAPPALPMAPPAATSASNAEAAAAQAARVRRSVQLTLLGPFPDQAILDIEARLRTQLEVEVLPSERRELPKAAYYPARKRYRAERLLSALEHKQRRGVGQLGLTEVDISTTKGKVKDWGVFGLASIGGDSAVISTHRLRRDQPDEARYRFRVVTTAAHEIGHMLGLDHCSEPHCLMNDAEGSIRTVDESTGELGPKCRALLDRLAPRNRLPLPTPNE